MEGLGNQPEWAAGAVLLFREPLALAAIGVLSGLALVPALLTGGCVVSMRVRRSAGGLAA